MVKPAAPTDKVPWSMGQALGVGLAAFLLPQIALGAIIAFIASSREQDIDTLITDDNFFLVFVITMFISLMGSAIIYGFAKSKSAVKRLGFKKTTMIDIGLALPAYVAYFVAILVVNLALTAWFPELDLDQAQDSGFTDAAGISLVLAFLTLVVVAPIYEELLFRGFVFRGVAAKVGLWPAAIAVSALFGLAHGQVNVAIDTFILGLAASWLVWHTKSIWPAIMLHVIKNFIAYLFIFVFEVEF